MFDNFKKRRKQKIINQYSNPLKVKDLILKLFDRENTVYSVREVYEDNFIKVEYNYSTSDGHEYFVYVKDEENLIEVFNRTSESMQTVKVFVVGEWIYNLYLVANKKITLNDLVDIKNHKKLNVIKNNRLDDIN